jgi:hypothetical protein
MHMKKLILTILMTLLVPVAAMAMDHSKMEMDHDAKKMDHSKMEMDHDAKKMDHGGKDMDHGGKDMDHGGMQGMVMLKDVVVDGVKGAAHLMDAPDGKGQMLMVMFTDEKTGAMVKEGRCAVKIETPDGKVGEPLMLMEKNGMFSARVNLEHKGMHRFVVGTKLADGQKRSFQFHHEN